MHLLLPPLRLGSTGPEVQNWQRFLNENMQGVSLSVDGAFGPKTLDATKSWQLTHALTPDGIVGPQTRDLAARYYGFIQFMQAKNYTPTDGRTIDLLVIHDMEYPEVPTGAEWCAQFFANQSAPKASAHFCVDNHTIVQCVREQDVAWHAPYANSNGIGIEHAGYASQSRADWLDEYSSSELAVSAKLVARLARTYGIPLTWLDAAGLKVAGARGITGHRDVSLAFGGTHTDPGPNFPIDEYLRLVSSI